MSQFTQLLGARLGLEDLVDEVAPEETVELDGSETVEGANGEVLEAEAEVEQSEDLVDELQEGGDTLTEVAAVLESAIKMNGGLDPIAAKFCKIAIESATRKIGIGSTMTASLENIGVGSAKLQATRVTLENIQEKLKGWWRALVSAMVSLYNKVKAMVLSLFDLLPKIKERAAAMVKTAADTKGTAKEAKFKSGLVGALRVANTVPTGADVVKGIDDLAFDALSVIGGKTASSDAAILADLSAVVAGLGDKLDQTKIDGLCKAIFDKLAARAKSYGAVIDGDAKKYGSDDANVKISKMLLGGVVIAVKVPKSLTDSEGKAFPANRLVRQSGASIEDAFKGDKGVTEGELTTLTLDEVSTLAKKVISLCDTSIQYKATFTNRDGERSKLTAVVDKAIDIASKGTEGEGSAELIKAVQSGGDALQAYWSKGISFESKFLSYVTKAMQACLGYGAASLKQYGAEAVKTEEPKKEEPAA